MKDITTTQTDLQPINSADPFAALLDPQKMDALARASLAFSKSRLVPEHFRGQSEDVFVVLQMAMRLQIDPMTMLQSTYVIGGRPGMTSSLIIALAQRSGIFAGPITWTETGSGKTLEVTAHATIRETGEAVSQTIGYSMAEAEGWTRNKKYQSMASHMLKYRSATWLIRLYAPAVLLGMQTVDELADVQASKAKPARASATTSGPQRHAKPPAEVQDFGFKETIGATRRKHINAKIGELGLDREEVKSGLKKRYEIDSTGQLGGLTDAEWSSVIGDLQMVVDAGKEE